MTARSGPWRVAALATVLLAACGGDDPAGEATAGGVEDRLTVFAAASLTDAFTELGALFDEAHPGTDVTFSFGPSSGLATQVLEGAPADVYASADTADMERLVGAGEASGPVPFATNELRLAVPAGNPGGVDALDDLARPGLLVGLCAEEVPCGRAGDRLLSLAGVEPSVDTREPDVRALLTKLADDELDAGLVYRSDVLAAGDDVEAIEVAGTGDVAATYPIVALTRAGSPAAAAAFVDLVRSEEGREVLERHGLLAP